MKLKILAFVMAGGEGTRLHPLTAERSKPAVPFGARYRIVDFVLSNLINSDIHSIYLLVQYKSQSLIEHIRKAWTLSPILAEQFVTVVPPQMRDGKEWFQGTADAVYQNLNLIALHDPELVLVFGADHIYRMDVRQMIEFHHQHDADVTVAALPVPMALAPAFGIIETDHKDRVREFQEKPQRPSPMPDDPKRAYASMGNYVFNREVLEDALADTKRHGQNDFGRHVLPRLLGSHRIYAYDFAENKVPGIRSFEEPAYWRDVGSIDAYYSANQDVLGEKPRFDIFNPRWPIYSSNYQVPVAKILSGAFENSTIGAGTLINGARLRSSVIRREVRIEKGVELEQCIIMDFVHIKRGARLRRVIVDQYNTIDEYSRIGHAVVTDRRRYHISPGGVVVLPASPVGAPRRSYEESIV